MSPYSVYVLPDAWQELKDLPGSVRQRFRWAIDRLQDEPRPAQSKELTIPELSVELRRLRMERWRIIYAVSEAEQTVDVLAVRKRPPYDYGDLEKLLAELNRGG